MNQNECEVWPLLKETDVAVMSSTVLDDDNVLELWIQKHKYGYRLHSAIVYHDYKDIVETDYEINYCPVCGKCLEDL